jgi:D-alanyl-D-alanine dipeptidase
MTLVEISERSHGVVIELAYGGRNNFTGKPVYAQPACFLHPAAARMLTRAAELAGGIGLKIKIFDAFRPSEAQWVLWNHTPDPDFLADPARGSPHSRAVAVDLTLTGEDGRDLDMGTAFDAFTIKSHHGNLEVGPEAQRNRILLLGLMSAAGWDFYAREWWHYQLFDSRAYALLGDACLPQGKRMMASDHRAGVIEGHPG